MLKTIKQLADELNVSKQNIRYHLKSLPANLPVRKEKGIIFITPDIEKYILSKVNKSQQQFVVNENNLLTSLKDKIIEDLKEDKKNQQEQIEHLQKLLENQQVLTLKAQEQVQLLEIKQKEEIKKKWRFWK